MKYYIRLETWFGYEYLLNVEGGYGYDSGNKDDSRIAVFKTLDAAKELCEMSDECIVDENYIPQYWGENCSNCMRNFRHPEDVVVDDCDSCNNTGFIKNNEEELENKKGIQNDPEC